MQKILIVEDDEKLRNEVEIFFSHHGYQAESLKKFDNTIQDIIDINPDLIYLEQMENMFAKKLENSLMYQLLL